MNAMAYRGCAGRIEYGAEDESFIGRIAGIEDIVTFHGDSVQEVRTAFEAAVDDYLATCDRIGKRPQSAYSGQIMVRIPPELHARAAMADDSRRESLTAFVAHALDRATR